MTPFWNQTFGGNTIESYAYTIGSALLAAFVLWIGLRFVGWRLGQRKISDRLVFELVTSALCSTKFLLLFPLILCVAFQRLEWADRTYPWLQFGLMLFFMAQVLVWGNRAILTWGQRYQLENASETGARVTTMTMLLFFVRIVFFSVGLVVIIDNVPGVDITALVAGLGIGGIAVALAVQSLLADIFASLTITIDKPFVLGDFIIVGDQLGVVEHIGLKTTRIRSLWGEELVFANNDLLQSRIRNYKTMKQRRVAFNIGITYDTPVEKIRAVPPKIKEIIDSLEMTRFDRAHFFKHDSHFLNFEIVYYVLAADYNIYMDKQQAINLAIHEYFEEQGIRFALPTRILSVRQDDPALAQVLEAAGKTATEGLSPNDTEAKGPETL